MIEQVDDDDDDDDDVQPEHIAAESGSLDSRWNSGVGATSAQGIAELHSVSLESSSRGHWEAGPKAKTAGAGHVGSLTYSGMCASQRHPPSRQEGVQDSSHAQPDIRVMIPALFSSCRDHISMCGSVDILAQSAIADTKGFIQRARA